LSGLKFEIKLEFVRQTWVRVRVRSIHLVFRHKEWYVQDDPLYLKFWAKLTLFLQKRWFSINFCT